VDFVVDADVRVISSEANVSSVQKDVDAAAVASVDEAWPFPPMPEAPNQAQIEVSVPFKFSMR